MGLLSGESIPFNERGYNDAAGPNTYVSAQELKAGDATARLGIYLGALATEYRLLKNNGQDVTKVKHEIFCALNAINRVDYYAEQIIGSNPNPGNSMGKQSPNLNGFFVRGDISENFVKNHYKDLNYFNNDVDASDKLVCYKII